MATTLDRPTTNETGALIGGFRGVHHLVLNTEDIRSTIDFYAGVLGMPLIHAMKVPAGVNRGNPPFERIRHYFFDMGNDSTLAFFELPKGAKQLADRDGVAAMQHVSFSLPPSKMDALCERLDRAGVERNGPFEAAPNTYSVYFFDPNGVRLEVSFQSNQGDDQRIVEAFHQTSEQMLSELRTVTDDKDWLEWATRGAKDAVPSNE